MNSMDPYSLPSITIHFVSWGLSDYLNISIIMLLIVLSGIFAAVETAFSCCNKNRINTNADNGDKKSIKVKKILDNQEQGIIAVLIAINIAHVILSTLATLIFIKLLGEKGSIVSTVVITIIVFIFSETLPKNVAKDNADKMVLQLAPLLKLLIFLFYPLVIIFSVPSKIKKKVSKDDNNDDEYDEDDLAKMVQTIEEEGSIDEDDSSLIQNAIEFDDIKASEVYTPLSKFVSISYDCTKKELLNKLTKETNFSRIPVYKGSKDNIVGVILTRDVLKKLMKDKTFVMDDIMSKPYFINKISKLDDVLDGFSKNKTHIGFIVDKGKVKGLITMDDVLDELTDEVIEEDSHE